MIETIRQNVTSISALAMEEVEEANEMCTDYTEVLLHVQHSDQRQAPEEAIVNLPIQRCIYFCTYIYIYSA